MNRYDERIGGAVGPLRELRDVMFADLDEVDGGFSWWTVDRPRNILISDYTLGLLESVEANLQEAAFHAIALDEVAFAQQSDLGRQLVGPQPDLGHTPRQLERNIEMGAHVAGFFRAAGSVVDNVAGLVVSIGALSRPIVRADSSDVLPAPGADITALKGLAQAGPGRDLQLVLLGTVMAALTSDPQEWWPWANDLRNTLVHRSRPVRTVIFKPGSRGEPRFYRPLPRDPQASDIEAWTRDLGSTRSGDLAAFDLPMLLTEDATTTVSGVFESVMRATSTILAACLDTWHARRVGPSVLPQPREQWRKLDQGRQRVFPGYQPGSMPAIEGELRVHPSRARRIRASQMLDDRRHQWDAWRAAEK